MRRLDLDELDLTIRLSTMRISDNEKNFSITYWCGQKHRSIQAAARKAPSDRVNERLGNTSTAQCCYFMTGSKDATAFKEHLCFAFGATRGAVECTSCSNRPPEPLGPGRGTLADRAWVEAWNLRRDICIYA